MQNATMDNLEGQLGDGFYRCHRGYVVFAE